MGGGGTHRCRRVSSSSSSSGSSSSHRIFEAEDSDGHGEPLPLDRVMSVVQSAEYNHQGRSARIERCKFYGVDYVHARLYGPYVRMMYEGMDPAAQYVVKSDDITGQVSIVIGNHECQDKNNGLSCPLCLSKTHRLGLCPHLPEEIRPYS